MKEPTRWTITDRGRVEFLLRKADSRYTIKETGKILKILDDLGMLNGDGPGAPKKDKDRGIWWSPAFRNPEDRIWERIEEGRKSQVI
ncbi:MAG TPA: hypothetical protein ENI23_12770 [bacterium]|nr:hypothetical protein [bacterium]